MKKHNYILSGLIVAFTYGFATVFVIARFHVENSTFEKNIYFALLTYSVVTAGLILSLWANRFRGYRLIQQELAKLFQQGKRLKSLIAAAPKQEEAIQQKYLAKATIDRDKKFDKVTEKRDARVKEIASLDVALQETHNRIKGFEESGLAQIRYEHQLGLNEANNYQL